MVQGSYFGNAALEGFIHYVTNDVWGQGQQLRLLICDKDFASTVREQAVPAFLGQGLCCPEAHVLILGP